MLVLNRAIGQKVKILPDITVTVVEIRGNKVRLGFTAPKETLILREEIAPEREAKPCS